jgi:hypothetical protein
VPPPNYKALNDYDPAIVSDLIRTYASIDRNVKTKHSNEIRIGSVRFYPGRSPAIKEDRI